jgi:hypothetical protein
VHSAEILPESVGALTGLTSLDLGTCEALWSLPQVARGADEAREPRPPLVVGASEPAGVGQDADGLIELDLGYCNALRSLPESVGALMGVMSVDLRACLALKTLLESVGP